MGKEKVASAAVDKWESRITKAQKQLSDARAHLQAAKQLKEQACGRVAEIGFQIAQCIAKEIPAAAHQVQPTPDLEQKFNQVYKCMLDLQQAAWEAQIQRLTAKLPKEEQDMEMRTARSDTQFTECPKYRLSLPEMVESTVSVLRDIIHLIFHNSFKRTNREQKDPVRRMFLLIFFS